MDHINAALLTTYRDDSQDLAFSALPHAPKQPEETGALRRSLSRGLLRTARWLEPGVAEPAPRTEMVPQHQA